MKRLFFAAIAFLGLATASFAQEQTAEVRIPEGYQGFVEQENSYHFWGDGSRNSVALSTTHGFYFNGHTFVGLGIGVNGSGDNAVVPIYTALKYVFINNKVVSPVASVRLGSYIGGHIGTYGDLSVGVRFATKRDFAVSVSAAVSYYEPFTDTEWLYDADAQSERKIDFSGASLRFGIEW